MVIGPERRNAPRFNVGGPVAFAGETAEGEGVAVNVSRTGVRIDEASTQPDVGDFVVIRFSVFVGSFGIGIGGAVVRHTENGFTVHFTDLETEQRRVLQRLLPADESFDPGE